MRIDAVHAVVTGGASGLGEATVAALLAAGASVTVIDKDHDRLAAVDYGSERSVWREKVDITDDVALGGAIAAAAGRGALRVAVNCAGYSLPSPLLDPDGTPHQLDVFRELIDVNLVGTIAAMRHQAAVMATTSPTDGGERGVIVNVSSIAGIDAPASLLAYGAAKAGLDALTLGAARQLGPLGIRVVTIAPGFIATPVWLAVPADRREAAAAKVPSPSRLGEPAEFAALVRHIVENPYLNGTTIRLDAGVRM